MSQRGGASPRAHALHLPSLVVASMIMLVGTLYPPLLLGSATRPDHVFLSLLLWGMSVGFVRGVGLVPDPIVWRWIFSGWSCALSLLFAGLVRGLH